eukprot:scaffold12293_cov18-Tisochrysis_lutea.AAC.2
MARAHAKDAQMDITNSTPTGTHLGHVPHPQQLHPKVLLVILNCLIQVAYSVHLQESRMVVTEDEPGQLGSLRTDV